ncbi:hypothetical protein ACSBM8_12585 [Sphingomonas sp. ASY06-1R]|uniref:hypothetical protein n=1 Tax=Sphingomonas sp. ASY06-1R TaxID=3445771 RepID=UPI003FA23434
MIRWAIQFFRDLTGIGTTAAEADGFGQSLAEDIRFWLNVRQCRRMPVCWRAPTETEENVIERQPILGRFGDRTIAVADVAGRRWIVRERYWHGWPDPRRYVFFAMDGEKVWAVADFDRWPPC